MNSITTTLPRTSRIAYGPLLSAGSAIPTGTPEDQLRRLQARYESGHDPMIGVLPPWYRAAVTTRLRSLLAQTMTTEGAA